MRKLGRIQCPPKGEIDEEGKGGAHTTIDEQVRGSGGEQKLQLAPDKRQSRVAGRSTGSQLG